MAGDDERVRQMTTPYFDGYALSTVLLLIVWVSILDRDRSWVASWLQKSGFSCWRM